MGFSDYTDEWVFALTRQRRADRRAQLAVEAAHKKAQPLRFCFVGSTTEFKKKNRPPRGGGERRKMAARRWRIAQWKAGVRNCHFCDRHLTTKPLTKASATVDHLEPLWIGGEDSASNWAMVCLECNNEKGPLTEAEFRALKGFPAAD